MKFNIGHKIHYSTTVESVVFNDHQHNFTVTTSFTRYKETESAQQKFTDFDYVVVATGHFQWPHEPYFQGEETFDGKIIHSKR